MNQMHPRASRGFTRSVGMFLSVATLAVIGAFLVPTVSADTSAITITQTPAENQNAACLPGLLALSNTHSADATSFKLIVTASAPLCEPVQATAVVYAMPGNGVAWPQTLVETKPFTISQAGVTEITFAKGCDPVQFDVITGATPPNISPTGVWHGPMLFPLDTGTALQFFPEDCNEPTTTVAPSTTVPTNAVTTTTVITAVTSTTEPGASVLGATTVDTPTTAPGAGVLAETADKNPAALAFTGSNSSGAAILGVVLLLAGLGMVVVARRRLA